MKLLDTRFIEELTQLHGETIKLSVKLIDRIKLGKTASGTVPVDILEQVGENTAVVASSGSINIRESQEGRHDQFPLL
jgi:hypothetical protein